MSPTSLFIAVLILILAVTIAALAGGRGSVGRIPGGVRRNWSWAILLGAATLAELTFNRAWEGGHLITIDPSGSDIASWLPVALQATLPSDPSVALFGLVYQVLFPLALLSIPLALLARSDDGMFRRYCLAAGMAYASLIALHLVVGCLRPGLDPSSGIAALLYDDPFWGQLSSDIGSRGSSFPSGHTTLLVTATVCLWSWRPARYVLLALTGLTVIAVLYLGLHWPQDVLGGVVLGAACATVAARKMRGLERV